MQFDLWFDNQVSRLVVPAGQGWTKLALTQTVVGDQHMLSIKVANTGAGIDGRYIFGFDDISVTALPVAGCPPPVPTEV